MAATHTFEIRYGFWKPLLTLLGTGPRRTSSVVEDDVLAVTMGWAFRAAIPLSSMIRVHRDRPRWWMGIGVHGWGTTWTVNGAMSPMVAIEIDPPVRARILGFARLPVRRLYLSVEDPDHVVATLSGLVDG